MVLSEATCIVKALQIVAHFYEHESCGQCPPCREGTLWMAELLDRIENGKGSERDIQRILDTAPMMKGTTVCVLSDSLAIPAESYINKYREEFDRHVIEGRCPHKTTAAVA